MPFRGLDGPSPAPLPLLLPLAHLTSFGNIKHGEESARQPIDLSAMSITFLSHLVNTSLVFHGFPVHGKEDMGVGEEHDVSVFYVLLKYMSRGTWPRGRFTAN